MCNIDEVSDMSKNKKIILSIINKSNEHMTAEDLYLRMIEEDKRVSMATIYNNLNSLCEEGAIRRMVMSNAPDKFDKVVRHDHMLCSECGKITDVYLDNMKETLEKELGINIDSYELRINYVCEECQNKG